jgi:hypothetical protein
MSSSLAVPMHFDLVIAADHPSRRAGLFPVRCRRLGRRSNWRRTKRCACSSSLPRRAARTLAKGRSPDLNPRQPRLQRIGELSSAQHAHFVGRTWELVGAGSGIHRLRRGAEVKPVAVVSGLGGMGKTALTAEALALWESRFEWVLLYQAKPNRLEFAAPDAEFLVRASISAHDIARQAHVAQEGWSAALFAEQGDFAQAITQERRALALREQLPGPGDRPALRRPARRPRLRSAGAVAQPAPGRSDYLPAAVDDFLDQARQAALANP